jgi:TRAP-type transport system periplasmic protein
LPASGKPKESSSKEIKMFTNRLFNLFAIAVLPLVTACAPQVATTTNASSTPLTTVAQDELITLRLAVADAQGRPSEPYVLEFIQQVKTLSDGNITIEPTWDAGVDLTPSFEQGVVKAVEEGQYDLGLAGSRAWDGAGVTSFQALQSPFLITDDALAEAVAASDIATRMLDSLSQAGMTGLALWPEDLRHPFSRIPDKPVLSPGDFAGMTTRVIPSEVTHMLIEVFGGNPMYGSQDYQITESGLSQGFSLTGTPTATGNVIFFPKFQVLFANASAFEKLSEEQRSILRNAAAAIQQKAIEEHPSEVDAAAAWCADGGSIVMASEEQIAAFQTAAGPVYEKIEQDPFNAEMIAAIRELKAKTEPAPGAQACKAVVMQASPVPTTGSEAWSTGLPPIGTWRVELSVEDFVSKGVRPSRANEWAGTYEYIFEDGKGMHRGAGTWGSLQCPFTAEVIEDFFRMTYVDLGLGSYKCGDEKDDVQWRLDKDGLHFNLVANHNGPLVEVTVLFETKPWQKVADQ